MRPSIALCCILKNERENLPKLINSVKDCFDEIHLTDTGSNDGSLEVIDQLSKSHPIQTHHFQWVDDFAAARNYSYSHTKCDYQMWMDLDDVMSSAQDFIKWRDSVMEIADFWIATYHYSSNAEGKPICSFARERVIKRELGCSWEYFVHEGISPLTAKRKNFATQYATNWSVVHKRTQDDVSKDRNRNLRLFQKNEKGLNARMVYYYGKELFENGAPLDAFEKLKEAISDPSLEAHDRIMGIQYACLAAMQLSQFEKAIQLAHQGMQLEPLRAEFYAIVGDCYFKLGRLKEAVPYFLSATKCDYKGGGAIHGALFSYEDSYKHYPLNQLAKAYANMGDLNSADHYVEEANKLGAHPDTIGIMGELKTIREKSGLTINVKHKKPSDEIVISCHPQGLYEWDEDVYKTKGIGGSETAVVEMAHHLGKLTNRKVLVFNNRTEKKKFGNVSYLPASGLPLYFSENKPHTHIAWRHNIKLTDAPTFIWNHDLAIPNLENHALYDKVFCLSEFHKSFVHTLARVPLDKIWVTSNGIEPNRFKVKHWKEKGRVIFSSSPDRGLDTAMLVMDEVIKERPDAVLHCYYGFDNMRKLGKVDEANRIQKMVDERKYVVYHGNISQARLVEEMGKSEVWLYPTNFLETYCITAIEALCSKTYPVVRRWGALPNTLMWADRMGQAALLEGEDPKVYAEIVIDALNKNKHTLVDVTPDDWAWEHVAKSWVEYLKL